MSGLYSRRKGMRNEYLVRDAIRAEGYECARVPSSGAAEGFKGDLEFTFAGRKRKAEVKSRKDTFKVIYGLYDEWAINGIWSCASNAGPMFVVADTITKALTQTEFWIEEEGMKPIKIQNLQKLLGESEVLVIKNDRKQPLYIVYYS